MQSASPCPARPPVARPPILDVEARGLPRPVHSGDDVVRIEVHAGARGVRAAVRPHYGDRPVALEPDNGRDVRAEECLCLAGDRVEQRSRLDSARHERRHSSQRGLLVGEPLDLGTRLRIRNRRGGEVGELREPLLGVGRARLVSGRRHDDCAPDVVADDEGHPTAERTPCCRAPSAISAEAVV